MGAVPEKLKSRIGAEHVREHTLAYSVANEGSGVRVAAIDSAGETYSILAGAAIIATQKRVAAHLVPDMPGLQKEKMRRMPMHRSSRCKCVVPRRFSLLVHSLPGSAITTGVSPIFTI